MALASLTGIKPKVEEPPQANPVATPTKPKLNPLLAFQKPAKDGDKPVINMGKFSALLQKNVKKVMQNRVQ